MYNACDLIAVIPCKDEKLDPAVCAALQDYAVIIESARNPGGWLYA